MSDKDDCGSCDYQGEVTQQRAECMINFEWHARGYRCQDFKVHEPGKHLDVRLAQAAAKRKERDDKRDREHADDIARINGEWAEKLQQARMSFDRKWNIVHALISAFLGSAGTLIIQAIIHALTKK